MTQTNFIAEFKTTLIDKLNDYAGTSHYASDLAYTLFEGENADGSVLCNTYQTKEFIKANFDLFGYLVEYVKANLDMALNPFNEAEKAHVILLLEASNAILSKCPLINEKCNDKIELTAGIIETLTEQINSLNITDEDLF